MSGYQTETETVEKAIKSTSERVTGKGRIKKGIEKTAGGGRFVGEMASALTAYLYTPPPV